ncbi:hypothetical protein D3C74_250030 [compost metagenome]
MSSGRPNRCTGITAFVRVVNAASRLSRSRLYVNGSTSAKTGSAPTRLIASAVAKNVNGVVITSSPGPIPAASKAMTSASVPEFNAIACLVPKYSAASCSNCLTWLPIMNAASSSTLSMACITCGLSSATSRFRSSRGIADCGFPAAVAVPESVRLPTVLSVCCPPIRNGSMPAHPSLIIATASCSSRYSRPQSPHRPAPPLKPSVLPQRHTQPMRRPGTPAISA